MKKRVIIIFIISAILLSGCGIGNNRKTKKIEGEKIETVSKIKLGKRQYIEQLKPIKIENTEDTVMITSEVKWETPEHEPGTTISFSIPIPYTIEVDKKEYSGIYTLGESSWSTPDNNPKYEFNVMNLTSNGDIEILIRKK